MYDEFERAMTGRSSSGGMSVLGWLAAGFGFFFLVGLVGIGFAINRAVHHVDDMVQDLGGAARLADLATLADLEAQRELIAMDPDRGLDFLRGLDGDDPTEAFMGEVMRRTFGLGAHRRHAHDHPELPALPAPREAPAVPDIPAAPAAPRVSVDGNVVVAGDQADGHRSLVIKSDGEEVRFDLVRTDGGGALTIHSGDGQTRIDLRGTDEGGWLAIDSEEGSVRFDLDKGEDGAQLVIQTEDETVRLGLGDEAEGIPGWVPLFEGMPERPRPVYSLAASEGILGAVAWSGSAAPAQILSWYRAGLEAQGYDLRDEVLVTEEGLQEGSLWARNEADGRIVFLAVREQHGVTKVLLGYGEER